MFKAAAETLLTIATDPKRLGPRLGITAVLHTWGSALTHHPHLHCIVPGGGLSLDGERWVAARPGFFLPGRVLSRLSRRLLLEKLSAAHHAGRLQFFGEHQNLADARDFAKYLTPLHNIDWVVYAKRRDRYKTLTLATDEFIRRFLIHVLPSGFHRIRHYGFFANHVRVKQVQRLRQLLSDDSVDAVVPETDTVDDNLPTSTYTCQVCGAPMIIIDTFEKQMPRAPPAFA